MREDPLEALLPVPGENQTPLLTFVPHGHLLLPPVSFSIKQLAHREEVFGVSLQSPPKMALR